MPLLLLLILIFLPLPSHALTLTATSLQNAGTITVGGADTTAINLTTDSTGNAEVVLPNDSVGTLEILDGTLADADIALAAAIAYSKLNLAGSIVTGDIADNTLTTSDLAATLTFTDGDIINLSAINASSTTEGLILPQATNVSASLAEGQITWDSDDDTLFIGNGASVTTISGALGATVESAEITDDTIVNADINAAAALVDTKLATISTAGKVANTATTAASANTASAIVARDASGNFIAGTITAALTGNAATATALAADPADCGAGLFANAINASGTLTCASVVPADDSITSAKITNGTVVNTDLAAGSFTSITGTGTLTAGATGAGFTVALGTSTVTGIVSSANGGTGNGFTLFSGPTTSEKTFTLPNASSTILTTNAVVTVAQGGTGLTAGTSGGVLAYTATGTLASSGALTANGIVLGGGAGAVPTSTAALTNGQLLIGSTGVAPVAATLTGTSNQVVVANAAGSITLSTPQSIGTASTPQFARLGLGAAADATALLATTGQAAIQLNPFGAAAGNTGELRFLELAANGTNYVGLKAADSLAANVVWVLPSADGSNGQVVQTNGSGTLSFVALDLAANAVNAGGLILDGTLVNADFASNAAISYSRFAFADGIVAGDLTSGIVTSAKVTNGAIQNVDISSAAALVYSKLNLTGLIVAGDIAAGAVTAVKLGTDLVSADVEDATAIPYSKVSIANSIVSTDIAAGTIANADVNAAAAIVRGKFASAALPAIVWAASSAANSSATFMGPAGHNATEVNVSTPMPYACTAKNLRVKLSADVGAAGNDMTFTVGKNEAATAVTCTVSGGAGTEDSCADTVNTVAFTQGDRWSVRVTIAGTPASTFQKVSFECAI